ncbi:MAG: DUF59 domain-containing protein [Phycisphaerae bacterium]
MKKDTDPLRNKIIAAIKTVRDPEIPVDLYELGLIYNLEITDAGNVHVRMTLTTPNCPVAGDLLKEVEQKVKAVEGVKCATVELVWEPVWTKDRMSEAAKLELNISGDDLPPGGTKDKFFKLGRLP